MSQMSDSGDTVTSAVKNPIEAPKGSGRVQIQRVDCGSVFLLIQTGSDQESRFYFPCSSQTEAIKWMMDTYRDTIRQEKGVGHDYVTADIVDFYRNYKDIMLLTYDMDIELYKVSSKDKILEKLTKSCEHLGGTFCVTDQEPKAQATTGRNEPRATRWSSPASEEDMAVDWEY